MKKKKIVISGGHLTPALAVIEELQKRNDWEIFYFGRSYSTEGDKAPSLESKIIQEKGLKGRFFILAALIPRKATKPLL